MTFARTDLAFEPGLFSNRSRRASRQRWVDGNLVRFRDGVPAQVGGWRRIPVSGDTMEGLARAMLAWRPNNQAGRLAVVGTHSNAYLFDGGSLSDITPAGIGDGRVDSILGAGYGAGLFGKEDFGTPRSTGTLLLDASTWTFDMFGETLITCFTADETVREFTNGTDTALVDVDNAPKARAICVSQERHVFAFGTGSNPRYVQWSDREDRTIWTPAADNRAGGYEMQTSSAFQCGRRVRGQVLAWTQTEVVTFYPLNNALVYGRQTLDENAGIAGPRAVCVVTDAGGEMAFWMDVDGFYVFDGTVRRLDCELHDAVFSDINTIQRAKFEAASNVEFSEVRFSYCSANSNEINRCVTYCYANGTWSKASLDRLVWLDRKIFAKPLAIDGAGVIYEHEVGNDAAGTAMDSYVLSSPIIVGTAQQLAEVAAFWPDLDPLSDGAELTIIGRDWPGGDDIVFGPYPFVISDEKIDLAISTRQFQVKISGTGGYWELGLPQIDMRGGSLR